MIKDLPHAGLPGDYFYGPAQIQGEWGPYTDSICYVDPSGRGSDESVAAYASQRNGIIYLHEVRAHLDGYSDATLRSFLSGCVKYNIKRMLVETNFGDGTVCELIRKIAAEMSIRIAIDEESVSGQKEARIIDTIEPVMNQH
ncbi:hypothetical protein OMCYN_01594 [cyanobiont of Ornithocercus magnificus]|nr:hypothetical protein OMCYN_01594 [cyanobiont of Ornithocercus magnificus]